MISISHWGMFELATPRIIVSAEQAAVFEQYREMWLRPDGWIEVVRR